MLDLIATMDDATSKVYSAVLVDEEGTASTFQTLLEVFTVHGLPSSLDTDRGTAAAIISTRRRRTVRSTRRG